MLTLLLVLWVAGAAGGVPQGGMSCASLQELAPSLAAAGKLQLAAAGPGAFSLSSPGTAGKQGDVCCLLLLSFAHAVFVWKIEEPCSL
jgi:hypothetical protein